jgi:hypothetical protein
MATSVLRRRTAMGAALVLVVAAFWVVGGDRSGAGAGVGIAMVVLFFAGGRAPMLLASSTPAGQLFLLVAMGYVLRVVLLLVVLVNLGEASWLDRQAVAATILAGALAWTAYLVRAHVTSRQPTLEIAPAPDLATSGGPR